ncbi:hypothetical protein F4803DRAFT_509608 [Xylaria telfairii]|nr:hypothetical protein F4803DRAFT_509608 [Xylaria telfairii]
MGRSIIMEPVSASMTLPLEYGSLTFPSRCIGSYPGVFRNGGNPPEVDPSPCRGKVLLEFPILTSGYDYTGGPPGAHRVVVAMHGGGSTAYDQCFLMTHQGASGNLFNKCQPY